MNELSIFVNNPKTGTKRLIEKWQLSNGIAHNVFNANPEGELLHPKAGKVSPKDGATYLNLLKHLVDQASYLSSEVA